MDQKVGYVYRRIRMYTVRKGYRTPRAVGAGQPEYGGQASSALSKGKLQLSDNTRGKPYAGRGLNAITQKRSSIDLHRNTSIV
jgi:hypothetical protein